MRLDTASTTTKQGYRRDNPADDSLFKILVFIDDGYHEKVDGTAAGLECDLRPTGIFFGDRMPE